MLANMINKKYNKKLFLDKNLLNENISQITNNEENKTNKNNTTDTNINNIDNFYNNQNNNNSRFNNTNANFKDDVINDIKRESNKTEENIPEKNKKLRQLEYNTIYNTDNLNKPINNYNNFNTNFNNNDPNSRFLNYNLNNPYNNNNNEYNNNNYNYQNLIYNTNYSNNNIIDNKNINNIYNKSKQLFNTNLFIDSPGNMIDKYNYMSDLNNKDLINSKISIKYNNLPKPKINPYMKNYGLGQSAYLFDYLDSEFQTPIVEEFKKFWNKVLNIPPKATNIQDPYSAYNQLLNYSINSNLNQRISIPNIYDSEDVHIELLQRINNNYKDFKHSISIPQLENIYNELNWRYSYELNWSKKLVDKYDINGDGRLNAQEFIFLSIFENKDRLHDYNFSLSYCSINSLLIDPAFYFIDRYKKNYVDSFDIFNGLKYLKKNNKDPNLYNIYQCKINNNYLRTSCTNKFVIDNSISENGLLNINEFAAGIYLAYWDRQIEGNTIYERDEKNLKYLRWKDRYLDINCENAKLFSSK